MKHDHFIVQSPATPAQQLLLLFHGVGDNPVAWGKSVAGLRRSFPMRLSSASAARSRAARLRDASGFLSRASAKKIASSA